MEKAIKLTEYLKLGGKLEKVNWKDAYINDGSKYANKPIYQIEYKGENNSSGDKIYDITYIGGLKSKHCISWIYIRVDFVLNSKYL